MNSEIVVMDAGMQFTSSHLHTIRGGKI